ncbi:MAG: HTTM domain-containing protein [Pirellulaceae bacterium]
MSESSDRPLRSWLQAWNGGWESFWFTPRGPQTLAIIRIACGAMLAYVHIVWASLIHDFMGVNAWISVDVVRSLHRTDWTLKLVVVYRKSTLLWLHQVAAIIASLLMMVGLLTRYCDPGSLVVDTLMVCHRMTGALFGLDQVVVMLSMYLMLSHCGSTLSVDARLRNRYVRTGSILSSYWVNWLFPAATPSIANNVATRLLQLHLCVIYLFGGLSKMRGEMWFDGSAWYSAVNYEYQSLDITWIGRWRLLVASLTALTIFWETFYIALVWPRLTRPIVLATAVLVHGGIAQQRAGNGYLWHHYDCGQFGVYRATHVAAFFECFEFSELLTGGSLGQVESNAAR